MRLAKWRKWLFLIATGSFLLQPAPGGCPTGAAVKGSVSTGLQAIINNVIGAYVKTATNQFFNVTSST